MGRLVVLGISALGTACIVVGGPPADTAVQWLKARAGDDFDCPSSEVTTVRVDDKTQRATGCGLSARYVLVCDRRVHWLFTAAVKSPVLEESDCEWRLDSRVESTASK